MKERKTKRKSNAFAWYIKGEYHCDKCPFCWSGQYSPGCDDYDDCGCYIFGELRDSCRIIPPLRFIIGWGKRKKAQYFQNHEYDDLDEWMAAEEKKENLFYQAFEEEISNCYALCYNGSKGVLLNHNGEPAKVEHPDIYRLYGKCQDIFSTPRLPLKERWIQLLKDTRHAFIMIFKPYICR